MQEFIKKYAIDRKGTHSVKWDGLQPIFGAENLLPLWVADMDFKVADGINQAITKRIEHGVYGYSFLDDDYYEPFFKWMQEHFNVRLNKDWIRFTPSVVKALYHFVNAFTKPEEAVIIMQPVYYPFSHAIEHTGRKLVSADLIETTDHHFEIDFEAFEAKIIEHQVKLFILCSPHNPVGRVWKEKELRRLLDICQKHQVVIIADEIHQDFVYQPHQQIALLSLNHPYIQEGVIAVTSASKTFNIAGLTHSMVMIPNETLRSHYDQYVNRVGDIGVNLIGSIATAAAYETGEAWLESLLQVIQYNDQLVRQKLTDHAPEIIIYPLEGTYLQFINLNPILKGRDCKAFIQDQCGLAVDFGEWFGKGYNGYIRLNLATSPAIIEEAVQKILDYL